MAVKAEQLSKALSPMDITEFGIVIWVKAVHSAKAKSPIDLTVFGMVIGVKAEQ